MLVDLDVFFENDAQRLLWIDEEAPLKDQNISLLEERVLNLEKGPFIRSTKLCSGHTARLPAVGRGTITSFKEAEVYRMAFEKELTDRALRMAQNFALLAHLHF